MSVIYFYRDTSSDLSGSPSEIGNFDLLRETGDASSQINTGNMASGASRSCWFFTEVGDPGTDGTSTGNFQLETRIDIENANVGIRCYLRRFNSSGVAQGTEIEASEGSQTAGAPIRQYNWTNPNLGTWSAGDRLGVRVHFTNTSGLMNQSCRLGANLETDTLITPFTAEEPPPPEPFDLTEATLLKHNRTGPFRVGTDLYAVLVKHDDRKIVGMLKSEDDGATWDNVGDNVTLVTACVAMSAALDGSVIHVAHQEATAGPYRVGYSRFDTATDEWVATNTQVSVGLFDPIPSGHHAPVIDVDQSNGANLVIALPRVHSIGSGSQIFSSTNTGAGWFGREEYTEVRPGAIVIGDTQVTHYMTPSAFGNINSQTWNSLGAGGNSGYVAIDTGGAQLGLRHMGQQMKFVDNGVFGAVPYVGDDDKAKIVWWESVFASPPVVSYDLVAGVSSNDVKVVTGTPQAALLRNAAGDWFLIYVDTAGAVRWVPGSFDTWGSDEASGVTDAEHLSARLVGDTTVGVLVGDGTAGVTYETFAVTPAAGVLRELDGIADAAAGASGELTVTGPAGELRELDGVADAAAGASGELTVTGPAGELRELDGVADAASAASGDLTVSAPVEGPTNLIATPISSTQIDLSWDAFDGATGYDIEVDDVVINQDVQTTTYQVTDLEPDTEHKFRVGAVVVT